MEGSDYATLALIAQFLTVVMLFLIAVSTGRIAAMVQMEGVPREVARECPHCMRRMHRSAPVCPTCGRESAPWVFEGGRWTARTADGRTLVLTDQGVWADLSPVPPPAGP